MNPVHRIQTPTCAVSLDEHGICWLRFEEPNMPVPLEASEAIVAARRELGASAEHPQLLCVDLANTPRPTKESRDYTGGPEIRGITRAMAMVTPSTMSRVIGNFFLGFARGGFPTRLFSHEAEAVAWLLEQAASAGR